MSMSSHTGERPKRQLVWFLAAALVVAAIAAALLLSDGGSGYDEDPGDLRIIAGEDPSPKATEILVLADLAGASIFKEDGDLLFQAELAEDPPDTLEGSGLELRWDVFEDGSPTWIVSATLNVGLNASVVAQVQDLDFTTIDGSLPGEVTASGRTITVRLETDRVDGFPVGFEWRLFSVANADLSNTGSSRSEDTFPDEGTAAHFD